MTVSVVTTLFNEGDSVASLLDSLLAQSRAPDEIVVVDAGSDDGTLETLRRYSEQHPVLRVIERGGNRSVGRNIAIAAATGDVIAAIDGGCVAEDDWLAQLVAPFERGATWVAGFYRPEGATRRSTCVGLVMVYVREEVGGDFLPSARSVAFHKSAWAAVGGFPEHLEFAEDTAFDQALIDAGHRPVLVVDAVVRWNPPAGFAELARTMYRWGRGDGEAGLRGTTYRRLAVVYGGSAALAAVALIFARWLTPLALAPLAAHVAAATRFKYRWTTGPARYLLIPLAHLTARVASLIGFVVGRKNRRD